MRSAALFCLCAASLTAGCATGHRPTKLTPKLQRKAICRRMPVRQLPAVRGAIRPPSISREQETVLQQVAGEALESIVGVKTVTRDFRSSGTDSSGAREVSTHAGGTGVVISADGLILTNEHVVRNAQTATVVFHDGAEYPVVAIVVHSQLDLAVLRIERCELRPLHPASDSLIPGMPVVAVAGIIDGSPPTRGDATASIIDQGRYRARCGVVTNTRRSLQHELDPARGTYYGNLIETTTQLEPGFSGGPLLDSEGRLVGLNVAVSSGAGSGQLRSYALPLDDLNSNAATDLSKVALSR